MNLPPAFRALKADWIAIVTGTGFAVATLAISYLPLGRAHRWVPWLTFVVLWSLSWGWAFIRSWNRERAAVEEARSECGEIYAEILLDYLLERSIQGPVITFQQNSIADSLRLSERKIVQGLEVLQDRGFVKSERSGGWKFERNAVPAGHFGGFRRTKS
jgi:DNA-binding transcriptional ArsR family regulator